MKREAIQQTESKDLLFADSAAGYNFRVVVRFYNEDNANGEHGPEFAPLPSREAAQECSPRCKPWELSGKITSPVGAKEALPE